MAKIKIKTRKERLSEYDEKYSLIPKLIEDRLDYLKELFKFNDKDIENIKKEFTIPSTYNLQLLFYEVPLQYMTGRIGKKTKSVYTP